MKTFFTFLFVLFLIEAVAQRAEKDSLFKIMLHIDTPPPQRKAARDAWLRLQADTTVLPVMKRPQADLLLHAKDVLAQTTHQRDSVMLQLMALLLTDTTTSNEEKCSAIQLLAQLGTPKAYAFLVEHLDLDIIVPDLYDEGYSNKAIYIYLVPHARRNWTLMREIMSVLATKKFNEAEILPLTILLDEVVESDTIALRSLLEAFVQKTNNDVFRANKKAIEDVNFMLRGE